MLPCCTSGSVLKVSEALPLVGISRYYTLDEDTYPRFLHDDGEETDLSAFIHVVDPTKVKVVERERAKGEKKLLESTVRRVVSLLPVALAHSESDLEASVDKLFDEGGSSDQGDAAAGSGHSAEIEQVTIVEDIATENVASERPKRQRKKRLAVTDASAVETLPFITSSISATPEHEGGDHTDFVTGPNLRTIGPAERSAALPPVMTEAVVTSHAVSAPSILVLETETNITSSVHASLFHDSSSTETVRPNVAGPSHSAKQDLSMGSRELNTETLHQVFVPQWNVLNDSLLDDSYVSREFVDHLSPPTLFSQIREIEYHHLFTEFNIRTAHQACLNAEVRMLTEYCLSERSRLELECKKQADLLKVRDGEIEILKARLLLKKAEATEVVRLGIQVSAAKAAEKVRAGEMDALKQKNDLELKDLNVVVSSLKSQNDGFVDQMKVLDDKVAKLDVNLLEMALHLEEKFYPTYLPLYLVKAISHAIEKGMQGGLSAGIDHRKAGTSLEDVVAYNPAAEADYNSALRRLREPDIEQLTLPIHHSEDQVVLGETSFSFALSVTNSRVERIRENVAAHRLALIDVWVLLVEPLLAESLMGAAGSPDSVPATVTTTTTLSTNFASTRSIPPITVTTPKIRL
ncbi:hypothetical protein Tco_0772544 [Tanacetum coccineum]|uniref:Transposase (Putative), gypsy type n=1 Tax=Tanacetum coccineum TaxID=301880 RepID=A0ABQ4ZI74_9ASTR